MAKNTSENKVWTTERLAYMKTCMDEGVTSAEFRAAFKQKYGEYLTRSKIAGAINRNFKGQAFRSKGVTWRVKPEVPHAVKLAVAKTIQTKRLNEIVILKDEPKPIGPIGDFPDARNACKFIHGDPSTRKWQCCGHPRHDDRYCAYHVQVCSHKKFTGVWEEPKTRDFRRVFA